ncbi:MAG: GIY-YIG nuclease family protein [Candidatus Saliniplasma sp.]
MVDTGIYLLIIRLDQEHTIPVGALGKMKFEPGFYLYVGSAQNGLENRINRHLKDDKKKHWHIDYLLVHGDIVNVKVKEGKSEEECLLAEKVREFTEEIRNFGSSDCSCDSHLFYHSNNLSDLNKRIQKNLDLKDHGQ